MCEVQVDTETNTVVLNYDVGYDSERQTAISCDVLNMKQRQTLSSCVMLNTPWRQIAMGVCEKMMRGIPVSYTHLTLPTMERV